MAEQITVSISVFNVELQTMESYKCQTSLPEFEWKVWAWLGSNKKLRSIDVHRDVLPNKFYKEFFPDIDFTVRNFDEEKNLPWVEVRRGKLWGAFRTDFESPAVFGFRDSENEPFTKVEVPDCYTADGWDILGYKVRYNPSEKPWPWPVKYPWKFDVFGRLNTLLKSSEDNPITILMRSPQPYRGIGRQITKELEELRSFAAEVCSMD
jgi:hypothetical protein